jgi:hypothetical protein
MASRSRDEELFAPSPEVKEMGALMDRVVARRRATTQDVQKFGDLKRRMLDKDPNDLQLARLAKLGRVLVRLSRKFEDSDDEGVEVREVEMYGSSDPKEMANRLVAEAQKTALETCSDECTPGMEMIMNVKGETRTFKIQPGSTKEQRQDLAKSLAAMLQCQTSPGIDVEAALEKAFANAAIHPVVAPHGVAGMTFQQVVRLGLRQKLERTRVKLRAVQIFFHILTRIRRRHELVLAANVCVDPAKLDLAREACKSRTVRSESAHGLPPTAELVKAAGVDVDHANLENAVMVKDTRIDRGEYISVNGANAFASDTVSLSVRVEDTDGRIEEVLVVAPSSMCDASRLREDPVFCMYPKTAAGTSREPTAIQAFQVGADGTKQIVSSHQHLYDPHSVFMVAPREMKPLIAHLKERPHKVPFAQMLFGQTAELECNHNRPALSKKLIEVLVECVIQTRDDRVDYEVNAMYSRRFGYYSMDGVEVDSCSTLDKAGYLCFSTHTPEARDLQGRTEVRVLVWMKAKNKVKVMNKLEGLGLQDERDLDNASGHTCRHGSSVLKRLEALGAVWKKGLGGAMPMSEEIALCPEVEALVGLSEKKTYKHDKKAMHAAAAEIGVTLTKEGEAMIMAQEPPHVAYMRNIDEFDNDKLETVPLTLQLLDLILEDDLAKVRAELENILAQRQAVARLKGSQSGGWFSVCSVYQLVFRLDDIVVVTLPAARHHDRVPTEVDLRECIIRDTPYFSIGDVAIVLQSRNVLENFTTSVAHATLQRGGVFDSMLNTLILARSWAMLPLLLRTMSATGLPSEGGVKCALDLPKASPPWSRLRSFFAASSVKSPLYTESNESPHNSRGLENFPYIHRAADAFVFYTIEKFKLYLEKPETALGAMLLRAAKETWDLGIGCIILEMSNGEPSDDWKGAVFFELLRCIVAKCTNLRTSVIQEFMELFFNDCRGNDTTKVVGPLAPVVFLRAACKAKGTTVNTCLENLLCMAMMEARPAKAVWLLLSRWGHDHRLEDGLDQLRWYELILKNEDACSAITAFVSAIDKLDDPFAEQMVQGWRSFQHKGATCMLKAAKRKEEMQLHAQNELLQLEAKEPERLRLAEAERRREKQEKKDQNARRRAEAEAVAAAEELQRLELEHDRKMEAFVETWREKLQLFSKNSGVNICDYSAADTDQKRAVAKKRLLGLPEEFAGLAPEEQRRLLRCFPPLIEQMEALHVAHKQHISDTNQARKDAKKAGKAAAPAAPRPYDVPRADNNSASETRNRIDALEAEDPKPKAKAKKKNKGKQKAEPNEFFFERPAPAPPAPPPPALTLADAPGLTKPLAESTIGGTTTCVVCFASEKNHAFGPCGHVSCCGDCAKVFVNKPCPMCREPVQFALKVHMA